MRHVLRFILVTLALVLLGLALAPRAVPARVTGAPASACEAAARV